MCEDTSRPGLRNFEANVGQNVNRGSDSGRCLVFTVR
jgi:hypothetical protein